MARFNNLNYTTVRSYQEKKLIFLIVCISCFEITERHSILHPVILKLNIVLQELCFFTHVEGIKDGPFDNYN